MNARVKRGQTAQGVCAGRRFRARSGDNDIRGRHQSYRNSSGALRREDAARALRGARQAVADRALARRTRRCARHAWRAGGPAQDARAAALALDLFPRADLVCRHEQRVEGTTRRTRRQIHACSSRGRGRAGLGRRHAQMAAAAAGRSRQRPAARRRMRLYPGYRSRHAVRLQPGRLHAHLHLLPHRNAAACAQSHRRRNRRPGDGGARPARRLAVFRSLPEGGASDRRSGRVGEVGSHPPLLGARPSFGGAGSPTS